MTSGGKFCIILDRVAIVEYEMDGALFCVQEFVRSPHFIHRNFFSDSGVSMLTEPAALCDNIMTSAIYGAWSQEGTTSRSQMISDLCAYVNWPVDR